MPIVSTLEFQIPSKYIGQKLKLMGGYSSFTCQFNAVFYNQGEPRTTQEPEKVKGKLWLIRKRLLNNLDG